MTIETLKEGLFTLKMEDLHCIRKKLQLKNASTLKKAELIEYLAESIPISLRAFLSVFDEHRLLILKKSISNNGTISGETISIEEMEYFSQTGLMFIDFINGEQVLTTPSNLLPHLEEVIQEEKLLALIKRNTEWVKITRGLLYYYGTIPLERLVGLVEKYTPVHSYYLEYSHVIFEAMECYQEIYIDRYGYSFWEVMNPLGILEEQASRKEIEYYPFTKGQLLEAGETDYVELPKGHAKLVALLMHDYHLSKQKAIELVKDFIMVIKIGHRPGQLMQYIQTQLEFESFEAVKQLMDILFPLMNHTRQWYLKGYTSDELFQRESNALSPLPKKNGDVIDFQTRQKIGRNDLCPCGSGKKYKKCCGVN